MKLEAGAITNSHLIWLRAVTISSTTPSAKYSCSGSPLMFVNGSTLRKRPTRNTASRRLLAASLAHLDRVEEAREVVKELLIVQPKFTLSFTRPCFGSQTCGPKYLSVEQKIGPD